MREHVGLGRVGDGEDQLGALRRALAGKTTLVVVEGVDALDAAERDQAAAVLRDAASALRASDDDARLTLVVTSRTESAALALLADAHRPDVTSIALRSATPQTTTTAEVNA
ncbi:hypothetical protein ACFFIR_06160 [Microbacterium arthrosphaerae]|uniref:hypothetical protein n=1 Tax=Microbacterium arthrosphaerae TaxID=792652 RepID=UPI0035E69BFE